MDVEDLLLSRSKEGSDVNGWKRRVSKKRDENFGILFFWRSHAQTLNVIVPVECSTDSFKRNLFDLHVVGIHASALSPVSSSVGSLTKC